MSDHIVNVVLDQQQDYQFQVEFDSDMPKLLTDEPAPLGLGQGPSPVQLLSAAIGNCLSDSLLFSLRKYKQSPEPIRAEVKSEVGRNEQGRLRVLRIQVVLTLGVPAIQLEHLERALTQFESFCTVTQSVGQGIPIVVKVLDVNGMILTTQS